MFNLTITFSGLCLLVRDPVRRMLHVLMPTTAGYAHHIPAIVYRDQDDQVNCWKISNMHLELRDVTGSCDPTMPTDVFDFDDELLGRRSVDPALLEVDQDGSLPEKVQARVRLTAGAHGGTYRRGGFWNFNLPDGSVVPRPLPTAVNWVIPGVRRSSLAIDNKAGAESFEVFPDGNDNIHLFIVHVTREELRVIGPDIPPTPACLRHQDAAMHLSAYKQLLTPAHALIVPKFDEPRTRREGLCKPLGEVVQPLPVAKVGDCLDDAEADQGDHSDAGTLHAAAAAGSDLTCMVATAPVTPT